jgi:adhesin/invasin
MLPPMRHLRLFATGLVAAALLSCGGDDLVLPGEGEPAEITIVQGDGLSGRVGEALPEPLIIEVLDGVDRPVAGATVVVELSGAVAEPDTISTDADGTASAEITLGSEVGEASGAVRVIAPESPAEVEASFTVMALAASANGLAGVSGDGQTGPAGTVLPAPLVVQVTDAFGNPIEGVTITWTPDEGSVSEASTVTDGEGRTSINRTLGPTAGVQTTLASSEGLAGSPVVFTHTVTAGDPSGVRIVDGNNQTAAPGATLPKDLVVEVIDAAGNPVVAAAVTWVVTAGEGTLSPTTGTTDDNGRAATKWTLGATVGTNTAQAIVSGVGQAEFTATAATGTASEIRAVSGGGQTGQAGTSLASPLVVQVLDEGENPVSGVAVTWTVESGGGSVSPASATTGADGQASSAWTLGPSIGAQRVEASAPGAGSVRFEATAIAGAPSVLGLTTQPSGTAQVGVPFERQPVVQVRDAAENPVQTPGVPVTAAIASGPGQLIGTATQMTDANGQATFTNLGIDGATGPHSLIFAAPGFTSITSSTIEVNPVANTPPTAADDEYTATMGVPLSVDPPGVLSNDVDPDDPMTARHLEGPSHGTLTFNTDGSFDYSPTLVAPDSFTYQVTAGSGTASATARITVNPPTGP